MNEKAEKQKFLHVCSLKKLNSIRTYFSTGSENKAQIHTKEQTQTSSAASATKYTFKIWKEIGNSKAKLRDNNSSWLNLMGK